MIHLTFHAIAHAVILFTVNIGVETDTTMQENIDEEQLNGTNIFQPELGVNIKRRTLVAPWKSIEEFHQVYDWLFGPKSDNETRAKAISQMRIWSLRRSNLCPAAVLATTVLLDVQLKDEANNENQRLSAQEIQTAFASAFTRFFNYMSSIMQTHSMRTMYDTAQQLGLPTFVVDLRHLCAHGQVLPPIEVLRLTSKLCYDWLHDYYWSSQRAVMSNVDASKIRRKDKTQFDENVTKLFGLYEAALEVYCKGGRDMKTAKRHLHGKRLVQLKEFMLQKSLTKVHAAFDVIVKQLNSEIKRETHIKDINEIFIGAFLKMNYFFTVAEKHTSSTKELESVIEITLSLFRMLAIQGYIDELFVNLIEIAEDSVASVTRRKGASFWAMQILKGFIAFHKCKQMYKAEIDENPAIKEYDLSTLNFDISKKARKLLIYAGVDLKSTLIFGESMRRPWVWIFERDFIEERIEAINPYTADVVKSLLTLADPALTEIEIKELVDLIDVRFEKNLENSTLDNEKIYTVHDLLLAADTEIMKMDVDVVQYETSGADDIKTYGIWSTLPVDDIHDWSICPLGRLPWE